jgi:ArsR family transcriptional regulator
MSALDKPQPTVSHNLNILKNARLLKSRKDGEWIHYKLTNPKLPENLKELLIKSS